MMSLKQRISSLASGERFRRSAMAKYLRTILGKYQDSEPVNVVSAFPVNKLYYVHVNYQQVGSPLLTAAEANTIAKWLHENRGNFHVCTSQS